MSFLLGRGEREGEDNCVLCFLGREGSGGLSTNVMVEGVIWKAGLLILTPQAMLIAYRLRPLYGLGTGRGDYLLEY
jgi:hypothetical protein